MFKKVERQWGNYIDIIRCRWLCIKIMNVKFMCRSSMQRHFHRSEFWFILSGSVQVLYRDSAVTGKFSPVLTWKKGKRTRKSVLIPQGLWHQFFGIYPAKILEIQYGSDVRESDIERF